MIPKYLHITIRLTEQDGNSLAILGRCRRGAEIASLPPEEIEQFLAEAMAGDYDHLLQTAMRWFTIT